ncbi:MAG: hypothetical protein FWB91_07910 [Defluviitaleaceae bacterium]|nr:hypothetical protein [Defluviitaleaceae bacterium]
MARKYTLVKMIGEEAEQKENRKPESYLGVKAEPRRSIMIENAKSREQEAVKEE